MSASFLERIIFFRLYVSVTIFFRRTVASAAAVGLVFEICTIWGFAPATVGGAGGTYKYPARHLEEPCRPLPPA